MAFGEKTGLSCLDVVLLRMLSCSRGMNGDKVKSRNQIQTKEGRKEGRKEPTN